MFMCTEVQMLILHEFALAKYCINSIQFSKPYWILLYLCSTLCFLCSAWSLRLLSMFVFTAKLVEILHWYRDLQKWVSENCLTRVYRFLLLNIFSDLNWLLCLSVILLVPCECVCVSHIIMCLCFHLGSARSRIQEQNMKEDAETRKE